MHQMKQKILDEILSHLQNSQGSDFKSMLDQERMPKENPLSQSSPMDEDKEEGQLMASSEPKGLKIEKIEMMGKPPSRVGNQVTMGDIDEPLEVEEIKPGQSDEHTEMTDEELDEMLKNALASGV